MILLAQINSLLALFQPFFAQETSEYPSSGNTTGGLIGGGLGLIVGIFLVVAMWKVFSKAGQPGWAAIIPIYNLYVWCKIVGRPWWWILLMLIPFVIFIICIILCMD